MRVTQKLLSLGKRARAGIKFAKPLEKIIVHWIGPYPHQAVSSPWNWWENGSDGGGVGASAHFIVKDADIIQCVPLGEVAWHSGDARNYSSIGIEVIPKNAEGEFGSWTIDTLTKLVRHIRQETELNLPVERHFDGAQRKDCPRFYTPVTDLVGVDGRVANPEGGEERWENLKCLLDRY